MPLPIPDSLWSLRPDDIVKAFPDVRGTLLMPDGVLRLPPVTRGFDEFRDWSPGRSVEMNYLMAFPEVKFDIASETWHVGVRTIRLTPEEDMHALMLAVAFADEPGFQYMLTRENLDTHIARSLSPNPETLPLRMLLSAFRTVTHTAIVKAFYLPVLDAIPGLAFHSIGDTHKKFNGLWHGHRFQVKVRGRQARLNIWPIDGSCEHPFWHAHVVYPEPRPLWEQISGEAPTAVHTLFRDLAEVIAATESAPTGMGKPEFLVNRLGR